MGSDGLLSIYSAKAAEYLIAVAYLLLFIPFWRYVTAAPPARRFAPARDLLSPRQLAGSFSLPEWARFHPGQAWARVDDSETVTIGLSEFALKLVGRVSAVDVPPVGASVGQGEPAWTLHADGFDARMLSPVDGTVVSRNEKLLADPATTLRSPYEGGWLLKVRGPRLAANLSGLLGGGLARRWMEECCEALRTSGRVDVGLAYADGGQLVDGVARVLDPDRPERVANRFFLTNEGGTHE